MREGTAALNIRVILVGRIKEPYLKDAVAEYLKRLRPYVRIEILEIQDEPVPDSLHPRQEEIARDVEAGRVLRLLRPHEYTVAMDIFGQEMSSLDFSRWLEGRGTAGDSDIVFIVGGTTGLSNKILSSARLRLSMGKMTFPHQFMPLLLLEQVYRACKIARGEPYHR